MKIKCRFMEVGKPLFLAGTNYGEKLYPKSGKGTMEIFWDEDKRRAEVHAKGAYTYVTEPWVFTYEPEQAASMKPVENIHHDHIIAPVHAQIGGPADVRKVQVSTPMDKVQGKPGGRKAKFQGEETQGE